VVIWQNSLSSVDNYVKGILHTLCTSRVPKPDFPKLIWYDNRIFTKTFKNTCFLRSYTPSLSCSVHVTRRVRKKTDCEMKIKFSQKTFQEPHLSVTYTVM
jgi:hypothetical protein